MLKCFKTKNHFFLVSVLINFIWQRYMIIYLKHQYIFREAAKGYIKVKERKSWHDAKEHCNSLGRRLMEVRTEDEFHRAKRFRMESGRDFWLGGSDREVEGEWRWESNDDLIHNKFWFSGAPNLRRREDCLFMGEFAFDDNICSFTYPFVCEFD